MKLTPPLHQHSHNAGFARLATAVLLAIAAAGLPGCDGNGPTDTEVTTSTEGAQAGVDARVVEADATAASGPTGDANTGTLPLPLYQSATSSETLFRLVQKGTGASGYFEVDNSSSIGNALVGFSNGAGYSVAGWAYGKGSAGHFEINNTSSGQAALFGRTNGTGYAVNGVATGNGNAAVFENTRFDNAKPALHVRTQGPGWTAAFIGTNPQGKGVTIQSPSSITTLDAENTGSGFAAKFFGYGSAKGVYIQTQGGAGLQVVGGSKNAVVHTPSGSKALYTEESTEVWFTDYGFGKLEHGRARILFDPSFAQTINPDEPYHVFIQSYGDAELYVRDRTPLGFEVAVRDGDPNAEFSYRIVARRLGFESKRLEPAPWADRIGGLEGPTR